MTNKPNDTTLASSAVAYRGPSAVSPSGGAATANRAPHPAPAASGASTSPAVAFELSPAAQAVQSVAVSNEAAFDAALVQEIRQRIQSGDFQVNLQGVARGILRDAILVAQSSKGPSE
jgi:flagellar biosynthesis anti-sigma factor FlgM